MTTNISSKGHYRSKILTLLLTKYENSKASSPGQSSKQRPQFSIQSCPFTEEYFDEMDHRKREAIHEAMIELQNAGVIEFTWARFLEGREVQRYYLQVEQLMLAYELAGRTPKHEKLNAIRKIMPLLQDHPWEWVRAWFTEGIEQLDKGKAPLGMDMEEREGREELVQALLSLPSIEGVMAKRTFSQLVYHDTKKFEQSVEKRLLSLCKKYWRLELEQEEEYLDQLGLVVHPKLSLIAGPLVFIVDGQRVDVGGLPGGMGLTGETIDWLEICEVNGSQVLLVENLTCFHHVVQERQADTVVIFTGGFPHRNLQKLLLKVSQYVKMRGEPVLPVSHWGDLDFGGIQIFEFIRRKLVPSLRPDRMDVKTFESYQKQGIAFGKPYERKLQALLENEDYVEWRPLVEAILREGVRVEQESLLT